MKENKHLSNKRENSFLVKDLENLKCLAEEGNDFYIQLNFGLRSSKHIQYDKERDLWYILNLIDDTEQALHTEELMKGTNLIEALQKGALYLDP